MIGRIYQRKSKVEAVTEPKGFDDFELRLGDQMRGERATMGKSLLDVQRELRIKAAYIAAIENSDPSVFDTPGFIAGYVRSYARYLNMDPDESFGTFCRESGFEVAHGMSAEASVIKKTSYTAPSGMIGNDPFSGQNMTFAPAGDSFFSHIEPRAIGSMLVLLALIAGIGYGGWSVLRQIQQVQFAPVEQAPVVLSDLDPLTSASGAAPRRGLVAPSAESLDRLYRPQALDLPVLVARDAPISTLDPRQGGNFSTPQLPRVQLAQNPQAQPQNMAAIQPRTALSVPQVFEATNPQLRMVAVRPSWVRVSAADGTVIFETIMESGQTYDVPTTEQPPTLHAGESGAIYFAVNGQLLGPVGESGAVTRNLPLSIADVSDRFDVADLKQDGDLARMVAEAHIPDVNQ
ncbi:MAG: helix-turn-helix domain-containing protein [Rhodobacteraceae bacterium]|nr:MAG: helix-turn-helix domain-containing protein [Paracoccaceae bacterium]